MGQEINVWALIPTHHTGTFVSWGCESAACGSKVLMDKGSGLSLVISGGFWLSAGQSCSQGSHSGSPKATNITQGPGQPCCLSQAFNDRCCMLTGHTTYSPAIVSADPCPTDGLFKALLKPLQNPSLFYPDDSHPSHSEFSLYA